MKKKAIRQEFALPSSLADAASGNGKKSDDLSNSTLINNKPTAAVEESPADSAATEAAAAATVTTYTSSSQETDRLSLNSHDDDEKDSDGIMHSHNSHQRFYHYAGPPSIVMGTWGDRSRSQFAPPPAPFAIPPAGVPGGRLGPAPPNRINAGYHSLQYTPVVSHPVDYGKVLDKKTSNSSKHHRHQHDHQHHHHGGHHQLVGHHQQVVAVQPVGSGDQQQLHKLPQVKAFVTQVEQSAKKQLKSSKSQREPTINPSSKSKKHQQSLWADSDPAPKSIKPMIQPAQQSKVAPPVTPSPTPPAPQPAPPPSSLSSSKPDKSQKEVISPKSMVLTLSKQANGSSSPPAHSNGNGNHNTSSSSESSLDRPPKPQFYFGQTMNEVVRKSSVPVNGNHQTAIDKVKKNEALSHPKRSDQEKATTKVAVVTELNKKGRHTSIISVSDEPYSGNVVVEAKKISSQKAASQSSGVSSLSSSSSNSSGSTRSSPAKDASPSPPCSPAKQQQVAPPAPLLQKQSLKIKTVEPTQDFIRKAFEAQLIAGKSRLKKVDDEVGQGMAKPPPASVPPPASIQRIFPVPVAPVGAVATVPPPPPPMPPSEVAFQRNGGVPRSYEIPQAPKLKKTPPKMATKKGLVAPNGLSTREELMNAIRGTGGFHGLRKINSGKNL